MHRFLVSPSCSPGPQSLELGRKPSKNKPLVTCMVKSSISLPSLIPFAHSPLHRDPVPPPAVLAPIPQGWTENLPGL